MLKLAIGLAASLASTALGPAAASPASAGYTSIALSMPVAFERPATAARLTFRVSGCPSSGCALGVPYLVDVVEVRGERFLIFLVPAPSAEGLRSEIDAIGAAAKSSGESVQLADVEYDLDCRAAELDAATLAESDARAVLGYLGATRVQIVARYEWPVAAARNKADFHYVCMGDRSAPPPAPGTIANRSLNPNIVIDRVVVVRALAMLPARQSRSTVVNPPDANVISGLVDRRSAAAGMLSIGVAYLLPAGVDVVAEIISSNPLANPPAALAGAGATAVDNGDGSADVALPFAQYARVRQGIAGTQFRNAAQSIVATSCNTAHAQALGQALAGTLAPGNDLSNIADVEEIPIRQLVLCGKVSRPRPFSTLDDSLGRPTYGSVVRPFFPMSPSR